MLIAPVSVAADIGILVGSLWFLNTALADMEDGMPWL